MASSAVDWISQVSKNSAGADAPAMSARPVIAAPPSIPLESDLADVGGFPRAYRRLLVEGDPVLFGWDPAHHDQGILAADRHAGDEELPLPVGGHLAQAE